MESRSKNMERKKGPKSPNQHIIMDVQDDNDEEQHATQNRQQKQDENNTKIANWTISSSSSLFLL